VLRCPWLGIWPIKTSASKPLSMAVNVSGREGKTKIPCGQPQLATSKRIPRVFGLSHKEIKDKEDWRVETENQLCECINF